MVRNRLGTLMGNGDPLSGAFNLGISEAVEIADGGRARLADAVLRECGRSLAEYTNTARAADDAATGRDSCPEQLEQESRGMAQHAQARISIAALEALIARLRDLPGPKTIVLLPEGMIVDPRRADAIVAYLEFQPGPTVRVAAVRVEIARGPSAPALLSAVAKLSPGADGWARHTAVYDSGPMTIRCGP